MKVNFICPGLGDSGGIKVVEKYAELLNERGVDTIIYSSIRSSNVHRYQSSLKNALHQVYCTAKAIPEIKRKPNRRWVWKISDRYIRAADATIATAWPSAYEVNALRPECGRKLYFIQDYEVWDNDEWGKASYRLPLDHIVIAKWIDQVLTEQLGCKPAKIVYNGIDTDFFKPSKAEKRHDDIRCLMLYHPLEKKGVKDGVRAFEMAKKRNTKLSLEMFGMYDKPDIACLNRYYQNPSRDSLRKLYQQADIYIFPSLAEGWGLTPLEAMACGCPVAGTNVGCMSELGQDGGNVLLSEPGDVNKLASNILLLANDPKLRNKITERGRRTVLQLSWDKSADRLMHYLLVSE